MKASNNVANATDIAAEDLFNLEDLRARKHIQELVTFLKSHNVAEAELEGIKIKFFEPKQSQAVLVKNKNSFNEMDRQKLKEEARKELEADLFYSAT